MMKKKKIEPFENIKIGNNIFHICVRVSTRNRSNGMWENKYLNNMEQIKDWNELFPNWHKPSEDQFHWVVRYAKKSLFKTFITLTQIINGNHMCPIVLNNVYECNELIRLINNNVVFIIDNMVGTIDTNINRIEELFEPYAATFVSERWCKFRIGNKLFIGRTYLTDKFNQDAEKFIGCVFEDGGTTHKRWSEQSFDEFEYLDI